MSLAAIRNMWSEQAVHTTLYPSNKHWSTYNLLNEAEICELITVESNYIKTNYNGIPSNIVSNYSVVPSYNVAI